MNEIIEKRGDIYSARSLFPLKSLQLPILVDDCDKSICRCGTTFGIWSSKKNADPGGACIVLHCFALHLLTPLSAHVLCTADSIWTGEFRGNG